MTTCGDTVIAVGGFNQAEQALGSVEAYDPKYDAWTALPPLQTKRYGVAVAEL